MAERIQKVLANAGYGSRRELEKLISAGRITINGKCAILGQKINYYDRITIDAKPVRLPSYRTRILAYYKQVGEVCTRKDEQDRITVFKNLPILKNSRWISIGRLDINTSGLLLFTNNGELANQLMHPASRIEREYAVRVFGNASKSQLAELRRGINLEDGIARFTDIVNAHSSGSNHWYYVVLTEGRNREVRRLWAAIGLKVTRLIRTRFGCYILPRAKRAGQYWDLNNKEITALQKIIQPT